MIALSQRTATRTTTVPLEWRRWLRRGLRNLRQSNPRSNQCSRLQKLAPIHIPMVCHGFSGYSFFSMISGSPRRYQPSAFTPAMASFIHTHFQGIEK